MLPQISDLQSSERLLQTPLVANHYAKFVDPTKLSGLTKSQLHGEIIASGNWSDIEEFL